MRRGAVPLPKAPPLLWRPGEGPATCERAVHEGSEWAARAPRRGLTARRAGRKAGLVDGDSQEDHCRVRCELERADGGSSAKTQSGRGSAAGALWLRSRVVVTPPRCLTQAVQVKAEVL